MYIQEQIDKLLAQELRDFTAYSDFVPQEPVYPLIMYQIRGTTLSPDWSFKQDYETIRVRFNFFNHKQSFDEIMTMMIDVERIFNLPIPPLQFIDTPESEGKLIKTRKVDESGPDSLTGTGDRYYWKGVADYEFTCQRAVGDNFVSSSSSSSGD